MLKTMSKINQNPHEETTPDFFSGYDRSSSCVLVHVHNESDKLRTKFVSTFFPIAAWIPGLKIYFELALQKIRIIDSHFTVSNDDSFTHSGYFYSASSSPLLLRDTPDYS